MDEQTDHEPAFEIEGRQESRATMMMRCPFESDNLCVGKRCALALDLDDGKAARYVCALAALAAQSVGQSVGAAGDVVVAVGAVQVEW
ncbi:MAG: hypothetical protein SOI24_08240 [Coriobacteriales bacterium]|jgi:hypothetical protein